MWTGPGIFEVGDGGLFSFGHPAYCAVHTLCDARSPYHKLDIIITSSRRTLLNFYISDGMLTISPRTVERLESWTPTWLICEGSTQLAAPENGMFLEQKKSTAFVSRHYKPQKNRRVLRANKKESTPQAALHRFLASQSVLLL